MLNLKGAEVFFKATGYRRHLEEFGNSSKDVFIDLFNADDIYIVRTTNREDKYGKEIFTGMLIEVYQMGLYRVDYNFYGDIVLIGEDRGDEIDLIKSSWVSDYKAAGWWLKKGMK